MPKVRESNEDREAGRPRNLPLGILPEVPGSQNIGGDVKALFSILILLLSYSLTWGAWWEIPVDVERRVKPKEEEPTISWTGICILDAHRKDGEKIYSIEIGLRGDGVMVYRKIRPDGTKEIVK